jgi:CheY-like chemotaxis protein
MRGSSSEGNTPGPSAAAPGDGESARRPRVLVIDDEPMLLRAIRRFLSGDADVVLASSGAEGAEIIGEDCQFDVVLCDLIMPGVSGIALYEKLGTLCPELQKRLVFLTGGAFVERTSEFLASVENVVLEKPPDVEALRDLVRRFAAARA